MSKSNAKSVLVSASPKVDQSWAVSAHLANYGEEKLHSVDLTVETIPVRHVLLHHEADHAYETLQSADAIVFIFPLYFFCLPAMLTRFLQDFVAEFPATSQDSRVYAIVNCGFPESGINLEAMRVLECFSQQTKRTFLGGVMVGCGGMLIGAKDAPFMRPVFERIDQLFARVTRDCRTDQPECMVIEQAEPKFPRKLYYMAGNAGWNASARKNGIRIRDIKRKPYQI
jgi:hypothetical protein